MTEGKRTRGLLLIAVLRLAKALVLVAVAVGVLRLLDRETAHRVSSWVATLPFVEAHPRAQAAAARIASESPRHLELAAGIAFAYAALFAAEGVGLWLAKVWAEYLTIVATTSFVPLEIYELTRRFTPLRVAALGINVAIVAYLVARRLRVRRHHHSR